MTLDENKVKAMRKWATPKNIKKFWGFLRSTGYYQKFVAHYAHITQPLTDQLRKDQFGWSLTAKKEFKHLKEAMTTALILTMLDFTILFIVGTD